MTGTRYQLEVNPAIPPRLERLNELAGNLWYSWDRPTRALFARLRKEYPGATVTAGTMDAFARELEAVWPRLPVVNAEIADTWIHGVGSDPWKVARFRELAAARG